MEKWGGGAEHGVPNEQILDAPPKVGRNPLDSLRKVCDTTGAEANDGNDQGDREAAFAKARGVNEQGMRDGGC